mmetsp:Transcript_25547/g.55840  ORF Transcript_25547/g.55840 Transcript_25547/m.55840 type:complete len:238 (-) Transcript_25547:162-875(-)
MTDVNSAAAATTPITPLPATSAIVPPPAVQHPLHLLDQFLQHLDSSENDASNSHETVDGTSTSNDNATNQGEDAHKARLHRQAARDEIRIRNVLRVAEFLYGDSGAARTVLDNALEVLDGGYGAVRCYRAEQSGRVVYVVRGSTHGRGGGNSSRGGSSSSRSSDYLCFLNEVGSTSHAGCFCPCRSFFERTKVDRRAVCKHLLAARLGPYLRLGYEEITVSEVQFAHIVSRHAFRPG